MEYEKRARDVFNYTGGAVLFLLGIAIEIKNFFFSDVVNGYEIVFGLEFITAGIFLFYGKFKGFKEVSTIRDTD